MSKSKKKERLSSENSAVETFVSNPPNDVIVQPEQTFTIREIAEQYIVGFKSHWWPGIEAFLKSRSIPETGTLNECKTALQLWGGGSISFK